MRKSLSCTLVLASLCAIASPAWAGWRLFGSKTPRVKNGEVVLKTGFAKPVTTYAERIPEMRTQSKVYDLLTRKAILARLTGEHLVNRDGKPLGVEDVQLYKVHYRDDNDDGGSWTAADKRAAADAPVAGILRREQNKRRADYIPPDGLQHDYSFIVDIGAKGQPGRVAYRVLGDAAAPEIQPWLGRGTNPEAISITVRQTLTQRLLR